MSDPLVLDPAARSDHEPCTGSLVRLNVWLSSTFWRIGPLWAVVAGAMAGGGAQSGAQLVLRLIASVLLADIAWGMVRGVLLAPRDAREPARDGAMIWMPYLRADSPLARLLVQLGVGQSDGAGSWQALFLGGVSVLGLSLLLGYAALALSAAACAALVVAAAVVRRSAHPSLALALADVGLPWLLGALVVAERSMSLADFARIGVLAGGLTALQWGALRVRSLGAAGLFAMLGGHVLFLLALVTLESTWTLALTVPLLAPPAWWLLTARQGSWRTGEALLRAGPWWWSALFVLAMTSRLGSG